MNNFWQEFKSPVFSLAPMEDVTDTVFREIVMGISTPGNLNVVFTEFTSVEGMNHPVGRERVSERLIVNDSERELLKKLDVKLVAQIWGRNPDVYHNIAKYITENYEFDGLDINMGCPVKKVFKVGACSALIGEPSLAKEIIQATKEATHLPVSVKTRTGIKEHQTEEWISELLEVEPAAIILHGRTQRMQSDGDASWDEIAKAVQLKKEIKSHIPFHGNGDVFSFNDGLKRIEETGVDGVMIGRGIFQNPWFFNPEKNEITKEDRIEKLIQHTKLFEQTWSGKKNFNILKRFYKIYLNSFPGAAKLRADLMEVKNYDEVYQYFQ
ncbi:MAG: tRNA-dihydrouridine synthase [Prolixibacteraceae bacterium]|jgi:nifR3 family TIM-barrel protein|nr:tRNA-dihydrouridine synthase [Prolixibacteraceae bacterium]MBT6766128.1 tRNA-dihydrouridine synthase [Prolixibacteraceae bacterium]MBT7000250.1 tRNA-dihydrouridine synthase [Prolixibacteraceae bacterium]MBT7394231.1 tRNA-dihydrouridine synthase [Prolixibacteraceae bacterium]